MAPSIFKLSDDEVIAMIRPRGRLPFLVLRVRKSGKLEVSKKSFEYKPFACVLENDTGRRIDCLVTEGALKFSPILKENAVIHIRFAVARECKQKSIGKEKFFLRFQRGTEITLLQEHPSYRSSYIVAPINDNILQTILNSRLWYLKYINRENAIANKKSSAVQLSGIPSSTATTSSTMDEKNCAKGKLPMNETAIKEEKSNRSNNVDADLRTLVADGSSSNNKSTKSLTFRSTKRTTVMDEEPEAKRARGQFSYEHSDRVNSTENSILRSYVLMIVMDQLPLSIGDGSGFRQFFRDIAPNYTLPNEASVRNCLRELYESTKSQIVLFIEKYRSVSLTIDRWSSQSSASFVTVRLHAIDDAWNAVSYTLDTFQLSEDRTADNLREHLERMVLEWRLTDKVVAIVHDNESDIVAAVNSTKQLGNSVCCSVNSLQCVLNSALKDQEFIETFARIDAIVGHFMQSKIASEALKAVQRRLKLPEDQLISLCKIDSNSVFDVIKRLIEQRDAINGVLSDREHTTEIISNALSLTPNHWIFFNDFAEILRHFRNVTKIVSTEQRSIIGMIRPLIQRMLNKTVIRNDVAIIAHLKLIIAKQLEAKFLENACHDVFSLASILDPRYKNMRYESEDFQQAIKTRLRGMMYEENHCAATATSSTAIDERLAAIDYYFDEEITLLQRLEELSNFADSQESPELEHYLREPILSPREDPLLWWRSHQQKFPTIAKIAKRFLAIPASSRSSAHAHVSRIAENSISAKRSCLSPEDVNILVFLHQNRSIVEYIRTRD